MMDKGIKQRLLGGIVLVAGAVLLLPYVIENAGNGLPAKPQIPAHPVVPAAEDMAPKLDQQVADLNKAVDEAHSDQNFYPVSAPAASAAAAVAASAPAVAATPLPVPDEVPPEPAPAVAVEQPRPAAGPKPEKAAADAALAQAKLDKVAQDKAAKAEKEAKAEKDAAAKAEKEAAKTAKEAAARAEKEAAAKAARATATDAVDMPAKPEAPKKPAVAENGGLPEAWLVQVASLGSEEKAKQLVARLHKKGYHASVHSSGSSWKVTVGPELAKDAADSMRQKLASDPDLKLSGWVLPYKP
jgi:DedD protein